MRTLLAAVAVIVALCGCGGPLDGRFAGQWYGVMTVIANGNSQQANVEITIVVSGSKAEVAGFCGSFVAFPGQGSGTLFELSQVSDCPAPSAACSSAVASVSEGTAGLEDGYHGTTLIISARGTTHGCGLSAPFTLDFNGLK